MLFSNWLLAYNLDVIVWVTNSADFYVCVCRIVVVNINTSISSYYMYMYIYPQKQSNDYSTRLLKSYSKGIFMILIIPVESFLLKPHDEKET